MVSSNLDPRTVEGFGREWTAYDQTKMTSREYQQIFSEYFELFPFDQLPEGAEGFDLGCGSGRWAAGVAPQVGILHCIDPSAEALAVAKRRLADCPNIRFHVAAADSIPLPASSQDFGYSLGVLHHIPDTAKAIADCVQKLKPGAPFLVYIYYDFENRPWWYRAIWRVSDLLRQLVSRLPFPLKRSVTVAIATVVYLPLTRLSLLAERFGFDVADFPLSGYRHDSFYRLRTDSLDRFGTRLEQRFSRSEIQQMMEQAGLERVRFRDAIPYWTACGQKRA
jgi:ubiquinone/menaquinone biosynthesis C-methylase UbiE